MATRPDYLHGPKPVPIQTEPPGLCYARTILPGRHQSPGPLIDRPRVLEMIDRPGLARVTMLVAPFGYGKTTVALQWAAARGHAIQYIAGRPLPEQPVLEPTAPSYGGALMSRLFSTLSALHNSNEEPEGLLQRIEATVDTINAQPYAPNDIVIVDDLHHLGDAESNLLALFANRHLRNPVGHLILIDRRSSDELVDTLARQGSVKVISQESFALDQDEIRRATEAQAFPRLATDEVRRLARYTNGWVGGMHLLARDQVRDPRRRTPPYLFDQAVRNEILLPLPQVAQRVIGAGLPVLSAGLWERFTAIAGDSLPPLQVLMDHVPILPLASTPDEPLRFTFPQALRESFSRLYAALPTSTLDQKILRAAIEWYVDMGSYEDAISLARRAGDWSAYLDRVTRTGAPFDWSDHEGVLRLTEGIPHTEFVRYSDLAYATVNALYRADRSGESRALTELVTPEWARSPDPILRGRVTIMRAVRAFTNSDPKRALELGAASYDLFAEEKTLERIRAASLTELAARHLGDDGLIKEWAQKTNDEYTHAPHTQHWWNMNVGHYRANDLAIRGNLTSAYHLLSLCLQEFEDTLPVHSVRYLLSLAYIASERNELDVAEQHLSRASEQGFTNAEELNYDLARARLYLDKGDLHTANQVLWDIPHDPNRRLDQALRLATMRAKLALRAGDVELASTIVESAPVLADSWPRKFGDCNVRDIHASIAWKRGDIAGARAWLDESIAEGVRRKHHAFLVRTYSIKAAMLSQIGDEGGAQEALAKALAIAEPGGFVTSLQVEGVDVRDIVSGSVPTAASSRGQATGQGPTLSERELDVLRHAEDGMSNRAIADKLFLSVSTVKNHFSNIYEKLGVNRRQHAVAQARRLGWL